MGKITRTVTTTTAHVVSVSDGVIHELGDLVIHNAVNEASVMAKCRKEFGKNIIVDKIITKENLYEMDLDFFVENAKIVKNEKDETALGVND